MGEPMWFQITEIFHSIQGESTHAGRECVFVRLTGCNLRCRWCDTEYAFHGGQRRSVEEVEREVLGFGCGLVEITGGEPLLQPLPVAELARRLLARGLTVMIETSGERDLAPLPPGVVKIVDVKCPGSGEGGRFFEPNLGCLGPGDQLKFVLSGRGDYEFALEFIRRHGLAGRGFELLFSPAFRKDAAGERGSSQCELDPADLAGWMLADHAPVRLSPQLHKYIWDPARHGV